MLPLPGRGPSLSTGIRPASLQESFSVGASRKAGPGQDNARGQTIPVPLCASFNSRIIIMKGEKTMVIVASITYPPESSKEMGKRFQGQPALPAHIKMTGPFLRASTNQGIQTMALYEVEAAKMADAATVVANRYANYMGVPGYKYSINIWFDITEALAMIGM